MPDAPDVPQIDIDELERRLEAGAPLIDVRQPDEYEDFHVPGARLVPLGEVPDRLDEIPSDETVYLICGSGGRSARAVQFLNARGYDAVNVGGGSKAWAASGRPVDRGG
ncbi:MAG: rhodanese-like domain-containing protein [Acidimicrobiales bacterium]